MSTFAIAISCMRNELTYVCGSSIPTIALIRGHLRNREIAHQIMLDVRKLRSASQFSRGERINTTTISHLTPGIDYQQEDLPRVGYCATTSKRRGGSVTKYQLGVPATRYPRTRVRYDPMSGKSARNKPLYCHFLVAKYRYMLEERMHNTGINCAHIMFQE